MEKLNHSNLNYSVAADQLGHMRHCREELLTSTINQLFPEGK